MQSTQDPTAPTGLIHDPDAGLHHAVPMPQQLPQIPIFPARYPDRRKVVLRQQTQKMLHILSIRLLFTPAFAALPPLPLRLLPGGANQFPGGSFTR